jgi:hypothetical protein
LTSGTNEANYVIVDGGRRYQYDVEHLPQYVKQDLEKQLEILKMIHIAAQNHYEVDIEDFVRRT